MAAVADPLENVVDREIVHLDANCFSYTCSSSSSVVVQFVLTTGLLTKTIAMSCIRGPQSAPHVHPGVPDRILYASGGPQAIQHGVHVMMSAKGLMHAHEAMRGIVYLCIPSMVILPM